MSLSNISMGEIRSNVSTIWNRLFDHRQFLNGEIHCSVQEFEQKRHDVEVDNLFKVIENITDIRDTEIDRFKSSVTEHLPESNNQLLQALEVCDCFTELQNKYTENDLLGSSQNSRKLEWDRFMEYITTSYSEIDSLYESKEQQLRQQYKELEETIPKVKI